MTSGSIFFNKLIFALCNYKYAGRTPEALDEQTCLTLLNSLINPVANIRQHTKSCERVENKGVELTAQQVMDAVIEYEKVTVIIQYYAKAQSYANTTGTPSNPKDTRQSQIRSASVANT